MRCVGGEMGVRGRGRGAGRGAGVAWPAVWGTCRGNVRVRCPAAPRAAVKCRPVPHVTPRTGRASSFGQLCPARPVSGRLAAAPRPASLQGDGRLLVLRMRARDTIADVIAAAAAAMLVPHHVTR